MFLPLGTGQVSRSRLGGRGGKPLAPPRRKKQKVDENIPNQDQTHQKEPDQGKKRAVSFDLGNESHPADGEALNILCQVSSAETPNLSNNLRMTSGSSSSMIEEREEGRGGDRLAMLPLLPSVSVSSIVGQSIPEGSSGDAEGLYSVTSVSNGALSALSVPRVRSNSAISLSSSLGTRARSSSVSSRSKAIPMPRPRTSSITSSVLGPLSSMLPSSSSSSSNNHLSTSSMVFHTGQPPTSSSSSSSLSHSSPIKSTVITLGGEKDIAKMRMKDFKRNRKDGKQAPSGVKRKEKLKAKREEEKKLRKMGVEVPKSEKKSSPSSKPRKSIFDEDESEETPLAPQVIIKDGKVVVDSTSLVYKPKEVEISDIPVCEDEDKPRVTSMSFSNRSAVSRWTEPETKLFYMALRQCGQDFSMIAQFFPGRDRKQIARKFKREEKDHPDLLDRALNPRAAMPFQLDDVADNFFVEQFKQIEKFHLETGKEPAGNLEEAIALVPSLPSATQAITADPSSPSPSPSSPSSKDESKSEALTLEELIAQKAKETAETANNPDQQAALELEAGLEDVEDEEDEDEDEDEDEEEALKKRYLDDEYDDYSSGDDL